jgi:UDP-N-acetylglucosamine/UDP-N-acetylgalactosamine diphosphorylase
MSLAKIHELLNRLGQPQLALGIEQLSVEQKNAFLIQLEKYAPYLSAQQKRMGLQKNLPTFTDGPFSKPINSGNREDRKRGEALIRQGKVGCLLLAGGQGTRLGFNGPKGSVPVSPIKHKSLFQIFCERTKAASDWFERLLPLCMMTSPLNHQQTLDFFEQHRYFGLHSSQVTFFTQEMLPFINEQGQWFLEEPGRIAQGPNGNGDALRLFFENGLWKQWHEQGVEFLNIIVVDNPLADPFDPECIGLADRTQADVVLKVVPRLSSDEKMGIIAEREGRLKLIEYSELPPHAGSFTLSNTGLFCISMEFIRHLYQDLQVKLPLHLACKPAHVLVPTPAGAFQQKIPLWKCEKFIFDLFDYSRSSQVLVYPREKIYAPLKNAEGEKSLKTVRQALCTHYREIYQSLTGKIPLVQEFELDPVFYYPNEKLISALAQYSLSEQTYVSLYPTNF